ncbi:MAG: hypothetical protein MSIBF_02365 [Candidatus Altiarchaeales archaeon IMC4]|nr:MAG: hypothetical protein MSIBF_02365 [Candidatus Altiarchaeales archaeon IMC4]
MASRRKEIPVINPHDEPTTLMSLLCESKKPPKELSDDLFRYKVVMCPNCGIIQTTEGEESFRCRSCNKASRYRIKGDWHVKIADFPNPNAASAYAGEWAERIEMERREMQGKKTDAKWKK